MRAEEREAHFILNAVLNAHHHHTNHSLLNRETGGKPTGNRASGVFLDCIDDFEGRSPSLCFSNHPSHGN
jgi:hypothetical protein